MTQRKTIDAEESQVDALLGLAIVCAVIAYLLQLNDPSPAWFTDESSDCASSQRK